MPFFFVRQDITKMQVDAIVNAANRTLMGGGGVDGAIHHAAGPQLQKECATLGGCRTGSAKRTLAYNLPCKYVIHTVGPIWRGGGDGEAQVLSDCYRNSLQIAADSECESVAFPLISAGIYGYPKAQAIRVAVNTIRAFLEQHDLTVYLVLFDRESVEAAGERFGALRQLIDDEEAARIHAQFARPIFANAPPQPKSSRPERKKLFRPGQRKRNADDVPMPYAAQADATVVPTPYAVPPDAADMSADMYGAKETEDRPDAQLWPPAAAAPLSLDELLGHLDESFAQMLFRKIDERGMTDAECYKKANIDRKLFSKIRSNTYYKPSKTTVLAFAIALELPLAETRELLSKAGYALSHSYKSDLIVEYFIRNGIYDVMEINEALFAFDQNLLGA